MIYRTVVHHRQTKPEQGKMSNPTNIVDTISINTKAEHNQQISNRFFFVAVFFGA